MILNFGIVGVGYWGPNYARILSEIEGVKLSWCCDKDASALQKMKQKYPAASVTTNLEDVVNDPSVDCIIVVTPASEHYQIVKTSLLEGKDVLVEKPLVIETSQAKELIDIAKKKKRVLAVDHTFQFNPAIRVLKRMIDSGNLGKVYYIYGLYNALGPIRKEISALWDIGVHFVYTANFLLGEMPISVSARGKSFLMPKMEDVVFINLEYKNGVLVNLHASWIDPVKVRQLVVVGSKKMAVFDDVSLDGKLKIHDKSATVEGDPNFANLQVILRYGDTLIPKVEEKEPLKEAVVDFIQSVRERRTPFVSGEGGMEVVKVLSAAQYSLEHGGRLAKF